MLIPQGKIIHEHLSTSFMHIDQLVDGLTQKQFSGYCRISFWEYEGLVFFRNGILLSALEKAGSLTPAVRHGATEIQAVLNRARAKDGELSVAQLSVEMVTTLVGTMSATTKYEKLSTDLTSFKLLTALAQKEQLSGYLEVAFEHQAGTANVYFVAGRPIEALLGLPGQELLGAPISLKKIEALCEDHGATFNVYQAATVIEQAHLDDGSQQHVPEAVVKLFEAILRQLEIVSNAHFKETTFEALVKTTLPRMADRHAFLDPFIGDFRYLNSAIQYEGEASTAEFVAGLCDLIQETLKPVFAKVSSKTLLPAIARALESVSATSSPLMDQLQLEQRFPEFFQDETYLMEADAENNDPRKNPETRKVLNLQGIGIADLGNDSILKEYYRVITLIVEKYVTDGGLRVLYSQLKKSHEYQQYQNATAFLQQFEPRFLTRREEQIAFWLNIYNFLALDGILEYGIKNTVQETKGFFAKTSYRLGEQVFSLDEIEHGILRNNQPRPYSQQRQFQDGESRQTLCIQPVDPRIHCCLSCGALSSPPLIVYTPKQIEKQLHQAAVRYLLANGLRVDQAKRELWASRSFYWYRKDFEARGKTVQDFISAVLKDQPIGEFLQQSQGKLTLRFLDYDWQLNGA